LIERKILSLFGSIFALKRFFLAIFLLMHDALLINATGEFYAKAARRFYVRIGFRLRRHPLRPGCNNGRRIERQKTHAHRKSRADQRRRRAYNGKQTFFACNAANLALQNKEINLNLWL
jgi:hypothetical protein